MSTSPELFRPVQRGGGNPRKRILFLCVGNACRSQMAEGFARAYGEDIIVAASAGIAPAMAVAAHTIRAMGEKNIDLRHHFPKSWRHLSHARFDLVINLSGEPAPEEIEAPVRDWDVPDPVSLRYKEHCHIRDYIETLVMELILELRREQEQQRA